VATLGAFFDANVLYPSGLRNFLMHLALTGIFRAHWSAEVHDEWIRNLLKNRPDITRDKLERTRRLMDQAAPDALDRVEKPHCAGPQLKSRALTVNWTHASGHYLANHSEWLNRSAIGQLSKIDYLANRQRTPIDTIVQ
jgi:hypothetical protein